MFVYHFKPKLNLLESLLDRVSAQDVPSRQTSSASFLFIPCNKFDFIAFPGIERKKVRKECSYRLLSLLGDMSCSRYSTMNARS